MVHAECVAPTIGEGAGRVALRVARWRGLQWVVVRGGIDVRSGTGRTRGFAAAMGEGAGRVALRLVRGGGGRSTLRPYKG
jgi:hypothetical protein